MPERSTYIAKKLFGRFSSHDNRIREKHISETIVLDTSRDTRFESVQTFFFVLDRSHENLCEKREGI